MGLREEFRLKKFFFNDVAEERFSIFLWRTPGLVYLVYRLIMAAYTTFWLVITAEENEGVTGMMPWSAYLTNWTYTLLTVYFNVHALVALVVHMFNCRPGVSLIHRRRTEDHLHLFDEIAFTSDGYEELLGGGGLTESINEQSKCARWYLALVWIPFNAVSVCAIIVSIIFWAVLAPGTNLGDMNNSNIQLHLLNSVLVLIEQAVTAIPVRLLHVVYPIIYGLIYMLFSLFYWVADHSHVIYDILDWGKVGPTTGYVILVGFVAIPIIHLFLYSIYKLKMVLFKKLHR